MVGFGKFGVRLPPQNTRTFEASFIPSCAGEEAKCTNADIPGNMCSALGGSVHMFI